MDYDMILQYVITAILLPLTAWGIKKLMDLIDAKIATIKNVRLRDALIDANDELERAVSLAVTDVGETFVKALKIEGKLTQEQAAEAAELALEKTIEIMSKGGLNVLGIAQVNIDQAIATLIEANVVVNKEVCK